ncbi:helix-turn-helix transcriptional regulator [Candidatus Glomeribacter gigasporarum]|uniref:helix-turn-helix transcriptional regulator n=1 Tax=Candidatus Glomeribacter gigasporarum TaxID=132144 RepID=UPI003B967F38
MLLQFNGHVRCENIIKFPVQNHDRKVIAFLTIFLQFTDQLPLLKLFRLYEDFYSRKEAIRKFLENLNIDRYFSPYDSLTYTETRILLYMCEDSRCKAVAKRLGCSVQTASNHISHIKQKLLNSCDIHKVLAKLHTIPVNAQNSAYGHVL